MSSLVVSGDTSGAITIAAPAVAGSGTLTLPVATDTHDGQHPEGRPLRKNYAGIGYSYDAGRDAFISPKRYPSWTLPVPTPVDGKMYGWDESAGNWKETP